MRRGILDFYFGNEQIRLGKEQNSAIVTSHTQRHKDTSLCLWEATHFVFRKYTCVYVILLSYVALHWSLTIRRTLVFFRLNRSFSPLTFPKLRFWPPKKKTTKLPSKFCNCRSFGPQGQKK